MKSKSTNCRKVILWFIGISAAVYGLHELDDYLRRDGLPKNQRMTLIKNEIMDRKIDLWKDHGEGYLPASKYRKLSFDTDGNMKTAEVIAVPDGTIYSGIDETKNLMIGEKKSVQDWDELLQKAGLQSRRKSPLGEKKDRVPVLWKWKRVR